jgi:hypothetical protein
MVCVCRSTSAVARYFSLLQDVQTGCGAHSDSCSMSTGTISRSVNLSGRKVDHSPSSSTKVKNECSYLYSPYMPF